MLREIAWVEMAHDIKFERPIFTRREALDRALEIICKVEQLYPSSLN